VHWKSIEGDAYWIAFAVSLVVIACWEMWQPWRKVSQQLVQRWTNHGILLLGYSAISMLFFRGSSVATAVVFENSRLGLLNRPWLPYTVRFLAAVLLLDLTRYALHWACHSIPILWRVHQVHHSDHDYDLSTGLRAHPLERFLAFVTYLAVIAIVSPPPLAVLTNELLSLFQSFFSHANASLPAWIERPLRKVFITPEMHRVHHSEEIPEQNANLGDIFPWWDRILGTYVESPAAGNDGLVIGLKGFQDARSAQLLFMLKQPFQSDPSPEIARPASLTSAGAGD